MFRIAGGVNFAGEIDGGGGDDTLEGPDADTTWTINAPNAGSVPFVAGGFSQIENLQGGSGADLFTFTGAGSISGTLAGGPGSATP